MVSVFITSGMVMTFLTPPVLWSEALSTSMTTQTLTGPLTVQPSTTTTAFMSSDKDIHAALKLVAMALNYLTGHSIPIECANMHSLCIRGANALSLAGYSDRQFRSSVGGAERPSRSMCVNDSSTSLKVWLAARESHLSL